MVATAADAAEPILSPARDGALPSESGIHEPGRKSPGSEASGLATAPGGQPWVPRLSRVCSGWLDSSSIQSMNARMAGRSMPPRSNTM